MQLVFIYGPAAAGKYTIASHLSEITGIKLFHNHLVVDLVSDLYEFGTEPFIELRETLWLHTFDVAANHGLSLIFTFAPEATVRPSLIDEIFALYTNAGGEVLVVELTCPTEVIESRLGNSSRKEFTKMADVELFREVSARGGFAFDYQFSPAISIDTSEVNAEDAASRISNLINN